MTGGALGGAAAMRPRDSPRFRGWQPRLCTLRHTADCRPCVTPGTARHRLAAVMPADRARWATAVLPALQS